VTTSSLSEICPAALTLMRLGGLGLLSVGGGLPDGRLISRLFTSCGVVMMKITSSTKTKSSSGVMFSSFIVLWPRLDVFFRLIASSRVQFLPARQNGWSRSAENLLADGGQCSTPF